LAAITCFAGPGSTTAAAAAAGKDFVTPTAAGLAGLEALAPPGGTGAGAPSAMGAVAGGSFAAAGAVRLAAAALPDAAVGTVGGPDAGGWLARVSMVAGGAETGAAGASFGLLIPRTLQRNSSWSSISSTRWAVSRRSALKFARPQSGPRSISALMPVAASAASSLAKPAHASLSSLAANAEPPAQTVASKKTCKACPARFIEKISRSSLFYGVDPCEF